MLPSEDMALAIKDAGDPCGSQSPFCEIASVNKLSYYPPAYSSAACSTG
jgi:hypothetical protein